VDTKGQEMASQIRRDKNGDGRYTEEGGSELLEAEASANSPANPFIEERVMSKLREGAQ